MRKGKQHDADGRRFLLMPTTNPDVEEILRTWLPCVTGLPLAAGPLQPQLRSGVVLCSLANAIRRGVVPRVALDDATAAMPESKRNAKV